MSTITKTKASVSQTVALAKFLANKYCQRTKFGKVIKSENEAL